MKQISNYVYCNDFISELKLDTRLMPNPYNDYPFLIIKNFLSASTCSEICAYTTTASEAKKAELKTRVLNAVVNPSVDEKIRKTLQYRLPDVFLNAYELSFKSHQPKIEAFFNIALTTSTKIQTLEYTQGSFYIKHADDSNELVNKAGETIGFVQVAPERKLSTVLFASAHESHGRKKRHFKGGELLFNYLYDVEGNPYRFLPEAGDMIVFPSNPIYSHEVLPVEAGYRLTLVQWHDAIIN